MLYAVYGKRYPVVSSGVFKTFVSLQDNSCTKNAIRFSLTCILSLTDVSDYLYQRLLDQVLDLKTDGCVILIL